MFIDKLKNRLAKSAETLTEFVKLPEEERNKRMDICNSCDQLHKTEFCKICGCYMPVKTYIPISKCPMKKW